MRLTTKGRFAVTAMLDLALRGGKNPVTLAGISERQDISLSYLEQLFSRLRRHELVESVRGPGGGYFLAKSPDAVSVADIIRAVDEPIDATQCGGKENCHDDHRCLPDRGRVMGKRRTEGAQYLCEDAACEGELHDRDLALVGDAHATAEPFAEPCADRRG